MVAWLFQVTSWLESCFLTLSYSILGVLYGYTLGGNVVTRPWEKLSGLQSICCSS